MSFDGDSNVFARLTRQNLFDIAVDRELMSCIFVRGIPNKKTTTTHVYKVKQRLSRLTLGWAPVCFRWPSPCQCYDYFPYRFTNVCRIVVSIDMGNIVRIERVLCILWLILFFFLLGVDRFGVLYLNRGLCHTNETWTILKHSEWRRQ